MSPASLVAASLLSLAYPAPVHITPTDQTRCDWGTVSQVNAAESKLILSTSIGMITFLADPNGLVYGTDGAQAGTVAGLKNGQNVRVYFVVDNGAKVSEVDLIK